MKIKDVKTYLVKNPTNKHVPEKWIFVKLTTDDGIEGIGEVYGVPFNPQIVLKLIESVADRFVIDTDPFQIERMWRGIYASGYDQHPDLTKMAIISGLDIACWDIIGKALNQPIYNLLGGRYHDRLRSYTYLGANPKKPEQTNTQRDPLQAGEAAVEYVKWGFTALKVDPVLMEPPPPPGGTPLQISIHTLDRTEAVVRSIREAVGDKCDICMGTHGQMTTASAIRLAKRLEKYDLLWFEEPVPPENRDEMARVARHTSLPIATGERLSTKYEFRELLDKKAAQILQFALGRVGGVLEAKKIAGMAEASYAQIAPHLWAGPVEAMANIQVDTCSPNFLIQESIQRWDGFHAELLKKPIQWEDGYIIPPTEPGLGIELNWDVVEANPYTGTAPGIYNWGDKREFE
jgi:2-dehydro-3-deoxyphosphogalactonate aldolase